MEELATRRFCQLTPVGGTHSVLILDDKKPLIIGRSSQTLIADRRCSKQQVEVCADYDKKEVYIKHLGFHPSRVVTKVLQKGDTYILGPMGWLELIQGKFKYHVHFGEQLLDAKLDTKCTTHEVGNTSANVECDDCVADMPPPKRIRTDSSDQKTLHSFIKHSSSSSVPHSLDLMPTWREVDALLVFQYGSSVNSSKVASFDLDNTVIETSSGRRFPTGPTDWKIITGVTDKLKSLSKEGYKVVLLSNQLGISKGKPTKADFKQKIEAIAGRIHIPLLLLASTAKDKYRKPCTGMWDHLENSENGKVEIDMNSSFYVGDAAGRTDKWMPGKKKDFSCTDRKFAANLGIEFFTPEEFFLNYPRCNKFTWGIFNPTTLKLDPSKQQLNITTSSHQEMVIFVGYPASGKSTYFKKYFEPQGYVHINRDKLGSWQKCVSKSTESLQAGKSVVIDNTNPDQESRKRYTEVARKFRIPVRCFQFTTSLEHAKHNNRFRELTSTGKHDFVRINDMVFNMYKSKFVEPLHSEGFSDIVKVEFVPHFSDEYSESLYHQFLE